MIWNDHSRLRGAHAFLSPSSYYWLDYSKEKLLTSYENAKAKDEGTATHEFAALCIERKQKLPKVKRTLNMYVNDCISMKMKPEMVLFYSEFCFGTTDAIYFDGQVLKISDLKTGVTKADMRQLKIYAALFCLEYHMDPTKIKIELRIYQLCDVIEDMPDPREIVAIMDIIKNNSEILRVQKDEEDNR